jgi:alkanesulfonate monooxygenase SsuD/methylene tetrahydromethanopterin reductase-like flavin-dependent oxidoreductase (luciferase family)
LTPARPGVDSADRKPCEPVTYRGNQITIDDVVFLPTAVQRPRVPVWVGGFWPNKAPMRRAARWDGAIPAMAGMEAARPPDVSEARDLVMFLRGCRAVAAQP